MKIYFSAASDAALRSDMTQKMGACVVKGGKVISSGYNHHRTHYNGNDAANRTPSSMHAEMHAILNATAQQWTPAFSVQQPVQPQGVSGGTLLRFGRGREQSQGPLSASSEQEQQDDQGGSSSSKLNGTDLYIVRLSRNGQQSGRCDPCARCIAWARWAGVRRIFHWNTERSGWDVVKVNGIDVVGYLTQADARACNGMVRVLCA
ncbi:hypothetical protein DL93DRAFT_2051337 [Clavulina sp. PMI_390]|nr:hypothetical protein DL93DRAFT_2051337 [Clavulina sp. PMI_390]